MFVNGKKIIKSFLLCILMLLAGNNVFSQTIKICDDLNEWFPYIYFERINGEKSDQITGFTYDLLIEVFGIMNLDYSIDMVPWKRCLREVDEFGKKQNYEMISNASYNQERAQKYHYSDPIYSTHPGVFYSKKYFPKHPPFQKPTDLNNYRLCGIKGYNFEMFHELGIKRKIDLSAYRNVHILKKVTLGKCDFFLSILEPILALRTVEDTFPKDIVDYSIPEAKETQFYVVVAKTSPRGPQLMAKFNDALNQVKTSGVYQQIYKKYLQ